MRCFSGQSCQPVQKVEVFDISNPQAPVFVTSLDYTVAKPLFGKLMGRMLLLRDDSGFQVVGEASP